MARGNEIKASFGYLAVGDIDTPDTGDDQLLTLVQDLVCELALSTEISAEGVQALSQGSPLFVIPIRPQNPSANNRYRLVRGAITYYLARVVSSNLQVWAIILSTSEMRKLPDENQFLLAFTGLIGMHDKKASYESIVRVYRYFTAPILKIGFSPCHNT